MTDEIEIIGDIQRVARSLGKAAGEEMSESEYRQGGGRASRHTVYLNGKTWGYWCEKAGVSPNMAKKHLPDEAYFERLRNAISQLKRLPKTSERKEFGLNFQKSRWPTLKLFLQDAAKKGHIPSYPINEPMDKTRCVVDGQNATENHLHLLPRIGTPLKRPVPPIPKETRQKKWGRSGIEGFPYEPHDESGVIALFAILCAEGTIPWQILTLNGGKGIDGICHDDRTDREIRVELKYILSRGSWNHPKFDFDYLVCWENRWKTGFPKPVIELRAVLQQRKKGKTP